MIDLKIELHEITDGEELYKYIKEKSGKTGDPSEFYPRLTPNQRDALESYQHNLHQLNTEKLRSKIQVKTPKLRTRKN